MVREEEVMYGKGQTFRLCKLCFESTRKGLPQCCEGQSDRP
jgi:hypothetical protein